MQFPPTTFDELQKALAMIRRGDIQLEIGRKSLAALTKLIENPNLAATNNIVSLSDGLSVSPASLTRLAKLLGFKGFNDFQRIFIQRGALPDDHYSQKLIGLINKKETCADKVLSQQLSSCSDNVSHIMHDVSEQDIAKLIVKLADAKRVFIFGYKQASAMASILSYGLSLIRQNVHMLGQNEHGLAVAIGQLRRNDVVVIFSSAPYSRLAIEVAAKSKKKGCFVISVTDSALSPLRTLSDLTLSIPTEGHYFTNSLAATCLFLEGLLSMTGVYLGKRALEKLKEHENIVADLRDN